MKMTAFKYVQRLGKDSFQVSLQTQTQNMNLYLMFDVCKPRLYGVIKCTEEKYFRKYNWVKSYTFFFPVWIV